TANQESSPDAETRETPPLYRDLLVQATFGPNRAIGDNIQSIELGIFKGIGDELLRESMNDPEKREFSKICYVTPDKKVIVSNKSTRHGHLYGNVRLDLGEDTANAMLG